MTLRFKLSLAAVLLGALGEGSFQAIKIRGQAREITLLNRQLASDRRYSLERQEANGAPPAEPAPTPSAMPIDPIPVSVDQAYDEKIRGLLQRIARLKQWLARHPDAQVPELALLDDADWFESMENRPALETENEFRRVAFELKRKAQLAFLPFLVGALQNWLRVEHGRPPAELAQLAPYLIYPFDDALLQRYELVVSRVPFTTPVITERAAPRSGPAMLDSLPIYTHDADGKSTSMVVRVDSWFNARDPDASRTDAEGTQAEALARMDPGTRELLHALSEYEAEHAGKSPTDAQQLLPYVKSPAVLEGVKIENTEDGTRITSPAGNEP